MSWKLLCTLNALGEMFGYLLSEFLHLNFFLLKTLPYVLIFSLYPCINHIEHLHKNKILLYHTLNYRLLSWRALHPPFLLTFSLVPYYVLPQVTHVKILVCNLLVFVIAHIIICKFTCIVYMIGTYGMCVYHCFTS